MNRTGFSHIVIYFYEKVKRFLVSKDLLIFLFFLLISTGLWTLHALRKNYETMIVVPVIYTHIPKGLVKASNLPQKLRVSVTDGGTTLLRYRITKDFSPITIDAGKYANGNHLFNTMLLESDIQKQLNTSTKIIKIYPNQIAMKFEKLKCKQVEVKIRGNISLAQQYVLCNAIDIRPKRVMVYATSSILDTMKYAYTEPFSLNDVKDTIQTNVRLASQQNIAYAPSMIHITVRTETYTEKEIEVKINPINVNEGYRLRTFPSSTKIRFNVGISNYNKINANSFVVTADYKEAKGSKIPLLFSYPEALISNVRFSPNSVDYILEKK
jgi:YbbR domain-containing protein